MEIAPFVPVIVEATKFLFGEVSKLIKHTRQKSGKSSFHTKTETHENHPVLTLQDFETSQLDLSKFSAVINSQLAEANAYIISGLVAQLKIHQKNLSDLETAEAEYGSLTPQHVKRGIEREVLAIEEKSTRLKKLLEQVHGKKIDIS